MVSLGGIARKIFGSANDRRVKRLPATVDAINALETEMAELSDAELAGQDRRIPRRTSPTAPASTTCWSRPSPWSARRPSAPSACAISTCS